MKENNYVGIYFNFTAWQEYIGGIPKKSNGELRFPNPLNTLKLGFGRLSQNGEISTGTHLIVIPEIECGVVTGQSDASILIVYRQFLLQVESGLLDNQTIEEKIKNLISQFGFQIEVFAKKKSSCEHEFENLIKTVARVFKSVSAVLDQEILAFRPFDGPQNDCDSGKFLISLISNNLKSIFSVQRLPNCRIHTHGEHRKQNEKWTKY